ncbi:TPA: helix-turn-helix transcriptional regulator [Yersinia enterocolitica]|uniref:LuxR family transcriptional regulator n=2 Tax=Yersinia massiliensis TaxID=419257 RepID=A0ABM6UU80_9GAMM|nr:MULTISPECIES: hypothetical protein [Yersinia]AVX38240.1 hypothetical protein DA391_11530 [Yersinia massiliensis]OWF73782.1 hypothetical protein B4902_07300 [Yersinia frederiksenii]PHZ25667.1 hypothetical protein CS535_03320 [Yersinia massiliensis]QKJ13021.1 hypothetical protein HRD68_21140 [Yersinia massiliensis]CNF42629.1 Uncharacterised protein [Yersinia frederiksenii]
MDVKNNSVEINSFNLKRIFASYFDWDDMDVNYTKIDLDSRDIYAMPSNYEWHLIYFDDDLDLSISERIIPGMQCWRDYSSKHSEVLLKNDKRESKIDICTRHGNIYEILSINSKRKLSFSDVMTIYKWKPTIADYAYRVWHQDLDIVLPLREKISPNKKIPNQKDDSTDELLTIHPYMRFGNVRFTRKEMITIRLLLSHRKVKEISAIQGCSITAEHSRIQRIKQKLNCKHHSLGGLFNALKNHGITLSCLETLLAYP